MKNKLPSPENQKGCPDPARLVDLLNGQLSRRKAGKVIDHVLGCPGCREEFKLVLGFLRAERTLLEELSRLKEVREGAARFSQRFFLGRWSWRAVSLVAAGLLAFVLIFSTLVFRQPEKYRADSFSGVKLVEPSHPKLSRSRPFFQWEAFPGADSYRLGLFDEDLSPIWTSPRVETTEIVLPAEVIGRLVSGKAYFWMVTAYAGSEEVASELERFVLVE